MYKRFEFEGDIHASLDCVPLSVRRKLDLAGLKISLSGWQQLAREERLTLCHLPVDQREDLDIYREVMSAFCGRRGIALKPLPAAPGDASPWNCDDLPAAVRVRAASVGSSLDGEGWSRLDEESRYALVKLVDPSRNPDKFRAALVELGFLPGPAPTDRPKVSVCDAPPAGA